MKKQLISSCGGNEVPSHHVCLMASQAFQSYFDKHPVDLPKMFTNWHFDQFIFSSGGIIAIDGKFRPMLRECCNRGNDTRAEETSLAFTLFFNCFI